MRPLLVLFLIVGILLSPACSATQADAEGILGQVDSVSGIATVKLKDGRTVTANLKDVTIETGQQNADGPILDPGTPVTVHVGADQKVTRIRALVLKAEGVIKSVDKGPNRIVTISTKKQGGTLNLKVTDATKIEAKGANDDKSLTALQVGQKVEATYNIERKEALTLVVKD